MCAARRRPNRRRSEADALGRPRHGLGVVLARVAEAHEELGLWPADRRLAQQRHLDGGPPPIRPVVTRPDGSHAGLLLAHAGEDAEEDRHARLHAHRHQPRRDRVRDCLKVVRVALDQDANRQDGVHRAGEGHVPRGEGQLVRARHLGLDDVLLLYAARGERLLGARDERVAHLGVPARLDDADSGGRAVEIAKGGAVTGHPDRGRPCAAARRRH
mmetsp:Transcript_194/g.674  ORF Transcript_194/g.674 Transcript_194/m.674 type:complete len:215 (+) Transcript_194:296-940(+)